MAYVQSKVMKKRLQSGRRLSGAALLREELNNGDAGNRSSLLDDLPALQQDKGVMMANFEEWIKMATDNKINSTNSWNFALIDYFHDLNVLRGQDNNINFQKASATLDGCVKIYSSRVDSVATETGRLLSGLATKKDDKRDNEEDEEDDGDEDEDDDEETNKEGPSKAPKRTSKAKKKANELGDTLTSFENLRITKLSQELAIDPLFKKTLAEFDEGGAKSLLLNTLNIDKYSRVVFDASTTSANDEQDSFARGKEDEEKDEEEVKDSKMSGTEENEIDVMTFRRFVYTEEGELEDVTLCPSFDHLNSVLKDINQAKSILSDVNEQNQTFEFKEAAKTDYDDYVDLDFGGPDDDDSYSRLDTAAAAAVLLREEIPEDQTEIEGNETGVIASVVDQDLMAYFDNTLKRNWAGPEHWRVTQLKKVKQHEVQAPEEIAAQKNKKKKELFTIDFLTELDEEEETVLEKKIFSKGKASATLPEDEWHSKDSNLLPDDIYFSSEHLTKLFSKPDQKLNIFRRRINTQDKESSTEPAEDVRPADATFWAEKYENSRKENDDAENPFYDDENDDDGGYGDFEVGYDEDISPSNDGPVNFGSQLIKGNGRAKSTALVYSKIAKNVNVKALKDNLWKIIEKKPSTKEVTSQEETDTKQFSSVVKDIANVYTKEEKKELSTSFCFICLLHLANEHSLVIENNESLTDLKISGLNSGV